ncbi:MAG: alpha/beta fold hydrolase [Pseudomonadota bacterium]
MNRTVNVVAILTSIVALLQALPCAEAGTSPALEASSHNVGYADVIIQTAHSGPIEVRVSYPYHLRGKLPLIVFSHGHYLTNHAYDNLFVEWAQQGFFVAAPQHIDTGEWQDVQELTDKVGQDWIAVARILDVTAVIDQVHAFSGSLASFNGEVSTDRVVVGGHSLGALTAQLVAGATLEKKHDSIHPIPESLTDDRAVAVVAISPPGEAPDYLSPKTWQGFDTPQLVITGTKDVFEHIWQDYRDHLVSYLIAEPGHNYLLVADGMDHYMGNLIGRLDRPQAPQIQALENVVRVSVLFMRRYLQSKDADVETSALEHDLTRPERDGIVRYERR